MILSELTDTQLIAAIEDAANQHDTHLIGVLADEADRRDRYTPDPPTAAATLPQSAMWYASQGLAVFPLQPGTKIPMPGSHGCLDATIDPATIGGWWRRWPDANIGIATGLVCDVVDLDGWVGCDSWAAVKNPPRRYGVVVTPRPEGGGRHLYIAPTGMGNATKAMPGVDWRGQGGYAVAPPSVLPEGRYWWRHPLQLPAEGVAA